MAPKFVPKWVPKFAPQNGAQNGLHFGQFCFCVLAIFAPKIWHFLVRKLGTFWSENLALFAPEFWHFLFHRFLDPFTPNALVLVNKRGPPFLKNCRQSAPGNWPNLLRFFRQICFNFCGKFASIFAANLLRKFRQICFEIGAKRCPKQIANCTPKNGPRGRPFSVQPGIKFPTLARSNFLKRVRWFFLAIPSETGRTHSTRNSRFQATNFFARARRGFHDRWHGFSSVVKKVQKKVHRF